MKIMTILGTRPEIIRLSRIIPLLDKHTDHTLIHTGQNYDPSLKNQFFDEMSIRKPDVEFGMCLNLETPFKQIGYLMECVEGWVKLHRPEKILILGDTNSGLSALVAKRYGIPVCHMEAGNRCFSDEVPEETNRRVIDACSDILMPYTERSRANLIREGYPSNKIFVTGNPIGEVLTHYHDQINKSKALEMNDTYPKDYYLVTMHRAENVDNPNTLIEFIKVITILSFVHKVIVSVHPHTRKQLDLLKTDLFENKNVYMHKPLGFFDFVQLEKNALCVLSDSGTVQEECAILGVPNVILRKVTERPETIEAGNGILAGTKRADILNSVDIAMNSPQGKVPEGYMDNNVSNTVMKILVGRN
jgi:UDP-N-acetylglucosamine 2-epimerase (non-hydrolysing)